MVEPNWSANVHKGPKSLRRFQSHLRITTRQFLKPCTQLIIKIPVFGQHNVITTFVVIIIDKPPDICFSGMIRKLKKVNLKKYALVMICKLCIQKYTTFWKWVAFPFHGEPCRWPVSFSWKILKWQSIAYMVMIITMFNVQWTLRYLKFESLKHRFESTSVRWGSPHLQYGRGSPSAIFGTAVAVFANMALGPSW